MPPSIQLLASRLDQLSAGERRAIERAAVEGSRLPPGAVEALADEELERPGRRVPRRARPQGAVGPYRASFAGEDGSGSGTSLIREAAYEAVPKSAELER